MFMKSTILGAIQKIWRGSFLGNGNKQRADVNQNPIR